MFGEAAAAFSIFFEVPKSWGARSSLRKHARPDKGNAGAFHNISEYTSTCEYKEPAKVLENPAIRFMRKSCIRQPALDQRNVNGEEPFLWFCETVFAKFMDWFVKT